jgi:hypothetical protein
MITSYLAVLPRACSVPLCWGYRELQQLHGTPLLQATLSKRRQLQVSLPPLISVSFALLMSSHRFAFLYIRFDSNAFSLRLLCILDVVVERGMMKARFQHGIKAVLSITGSKRTQGEACFGSLALTFLLSHHVYGSAFF